LLCGCGSDADCAASALGSLCEADPTNPLYGSCACESATDCAGGQSCQFIAPNPIGQCAADTFCQNDTDCPTESFCDPNRTCRARCDPGHSCGAAEPACDTGDLGQKNGQNFSGAAPGVVWCYQCLTGDDCPGSEGCSGNACGPCGSCATGKVCVGLGVCEPACGDGGCAEGQVCATFGPLNDEVHACVGCQSPADCPDGLGCNGGTNTCGTCLGPNASGGPFDCPPGAVCSNYWTAEGVTSGEPLPTGVCLADCDLRSCPANQPLCRAIPSLSTEHKYCVGCLDRSDCVDLGPNAWCDVSVSYTFSCQIGSTSAP
jgi:hypothetical protein